MKSIKAIIFLAILLMSYSHSFCNEKRTYSATRLTIAPPTIDGLLDDAAWNLGTWESGFVQYQPFNNHKPSQETQFQILYDDINIYVAIRAFDNAPDSIVQRASRRDNMDGDMIGIGFDSYFDQRTAFVFFVSAAGVKIDLLFSNDGHSQDKSWDPVWHVKTSVDDDGWIAEMQIPLSELRFSKKNEKSWGLQVYRLVFRKEEFSFWQHLPLDAPGLVHRFGLLTGIDNLITKRLVEITPYSLAKTETFEKQPGNPFATGKSSALSGGIDGKIGITNDLTMNFTINPDFGQVEADPSEVNLTAFETFFEEKRPFFVEGKNIFDFNMMWGANLFYSRRIGRVPQYYPALNENEYLKFPENTTILGAMKLSGKTKSGWSIGILEGLTGKENAEIDHMGNRDYKTVEPLTNYFIGRLQKDMNDGNTIVGGMFTSTNRHIDDPSLSFLHRSAYTAGFDLRHSWKDKSYVLIFKSIVSHVAGETDALLRTQTSSARYFQRPDAKHLSVDSTLKSLSGYGGGIAFHKIGGGNWTYGTYVNWFSPGLDLNDVGYLRKSDVISHMMNVGYKILEPTSAFRTLNINLNTWNNCDFGRTNLNKGVNLITFLQLNNYWFISAKVDVNDEYVSRDFLRGGPSVKLPGGINYYTSISTDSRKKTVFEFGINEYHSFVKQEKHQNYRFRLVYRPFDALSASVSPQVSKSIDELQFVGLRIYNGDYRYIRARIEQRTYNLTFRLNYSVKPELSIQYYGAPFFSIGNYSSFKFITNPHAVNYSDRFAIYDNTQLDYNSTEGRYYVDENRDGTYDYSFAKPDFKAIFLKSNLVARWEYRPGSVLFLIWSQGRNQFDQNTDFMIHKNFGEVFDIYPHNVFLVKLSYRFGI